MASRIPCESCRTRCTGREQAELLKLLFFSFGGEAGVECREYSPRWGCDV